LWGGGGGMDIENGKEKEKKAKTLKERCFCLSGLISMLLLQSEFTENKELTLSAL
jgi:hypothetical protein